MSSIPNIDCIGTVHCHRLRAEAMSFPSLYDNEQVIVVMADSEFILLTILQDTA